MIITERLINELLELEQNIQVIKNKNSINNLQIENFLRNLEKRRYNILNEIKKHNEIVGYSRERIKNISDEYKATVQDDMLKLYIPEPMPSYKNLKTHAFKNILLNIIEVTKPYSNMFSENEKVFVFINIFDNIRGWDVDNKYIKPITDALIFNSVIQDDNIDKMFYCVKGEFSKEPHTEVYVLNSKNSTKFLENYVS